MSVAWLEILRLFSLFIHRGTPIKLAYQLDYFLFAWNITHFPFIKLTVVWTTELNELFSPFPIKLISNWDCEVKSLLKCIVIPYSYFCSHKELFHERHSLNILYLNVYSEWTQNKKKTSCYSWRDNLQSYWNPVLIESSSLSASNSSDSKVELILFSITAVSENLK